MLLLIALVAFLVLFVLAGGSMAVLLTGPGLITLSIVVSLVLLLGAGVWVAIALGGVALMLDVVFIDRPVQVLFGQIAWASTSSFILVAAPLFILMGNILVRSGATDRLYKGLANWVSFLPGGLLHTNIAASAVFGSVIGSSMATAATVGSMSLPFFKKGGYNERLVLGSLAAGGTLGILIPPSTKMLWYALLTENSIGRLFLAGVIPGLLLTLLFMLTIGIIAVLRPGVAPREPSVSWHERLRSISSVLPILTLLVVVLGSIYLGLATPTESAAVGVVLALLIAAWYRQLNPKMLREAVHGTATITAMVALILVFADLFDFTIGAIGLPAVIASAVGALQLSPYLILLAIIIFYIVAGTFLDDVALTFATLPVIYPIIQALAIQYPEVAIFDGVAFGILFVVLMEMAIISPPDGINLYVLHGLRGGEGTMADVFVGVLPFLLSMIVLIVLLIVFPQLALWLPDLAFGAG